MSEPTLEQIAADGMLLTSNPRGTLRVLARELMDTIELCQQQDRRLEALERSLPAKGDTPMQVVDMLAAIQHPGFVRADYYAHMRERAERAERERDAARSVSGWAAVIAERDAAIERANAMQMQWEEEHEIHGECRSERDATRVSEARLGEALAKYGGHKASCVRVSLPQLACSCGYQDALDAKGPE